MIKHTSTKGDGKTKETLIQLVKDLKIRIKAWCEKPVSTVPTQRKEFEAYPGGKHHVWEPRVGLLRATRHGAKPGRPWCRPPAPGAVNLRLTSFVSVLICSHVSGPTASLEPAHRCPTQRRHGMVWKGPTAQRDVAKLKRESQR